MKKWKFLAAAAFVFAAGTCLVTTDNVFKADAVEDAKIVDGVYIGSIDVGGMTAQEASDAVQKYVADLTDDKITLIGPKANLELTLGELGLTADADIAVQEAAAVGRSGNLISRFKTLQDLKEDDCVIDMGLSIDKQATAKLIYEKKNKINIIAKDNGLKREDGKFVFVKGQEGNEVDIVTAVNELEEYISKNWENAPIENAEFTLASIVSQPRGTEEELAKVKDLLGSATTNYSTSGAGRAKNVENGAAKINGTILFPGEELSVYELVNPFTKENGYELAGAYSNGETIESFGGGICQVSTTLYNAALRAEMEITVRYNHSMTVSYVDLAADAAIAGTYKDLRFKNPYNTPVYVEGVCSNRNITFRIYGEETRASNRTVSFVSNTLSENNPKTEFTLSSQHALGSFIQTRGKHVGYVAELWKVVTIDGVETERTQVNKSSYQASCRKVTIGTQGATAEQIAAINSAIATAHQTGDDKVVEAVVKAMVTPAEPPADPNQPVEPTDPSQPTDPTQPTDPAQPTDPSQPVQQTTETATRKTR